MLCFETIWNISLAFSRDASRFYSLIKSTVSQCKLNWSQHLLFVIHNFICIHDPDDLPDIEDGNQGNLGDTDLLTITNDHIPEGRGVGVARRDTITYEMWDEYENKLLVSILYTLQLECNTVVNGHCALYIWHNQRRTCGFYNKIGTLQLYAAWVYHAYNCLTHIPSIVDLKH